MGVKKYDWIVVGGGISGIAISEILCRADKSVLLIEKNEQLSSETSKVFHEWFHSGSLYSLAPDKLLTLRYLLGATDDLFEYYDGFSRMNLKPTESALMAYARGIMHWHRKNQFCSRCGSMTKSKEGGHMRLCSNALCLNPTFPRTDPAVIMLVENTNANNNVRNCLLGRQRIWPKGMYSTLAGFVEPGESLEEAVTREVFEESGIYTEKIDYQCSQPWPFPSSIMLGFSAQAKTTKINFDKDELEDVQWFSEEEVRSFGEWGDESTVCQLPRKDSIARYLIETWLNRPTRS